MVAAETGTEIKPKMNFSGKVVKTSLAGALIDIGLNVQAVLHISQIPTDEKSESVRRVEDILQIGQEIEVWVKKVREGHVELTMIRPLDLEWREIKKGMNIKGKVVRIEKFGVFVEIGAERPGLVHISEMAHGYVKSPSDLVKEGDEIEAQVLDVNRKKKQIKLSMKALEPEPVIEEPKKAPESQRQYNQPQQTAGGPSKEKPQRRKKAAPPRKNREHGDSTDFLASLNDNGSSAEAEPTFMEIALREAMDKAKTRKKEQEEKNKKAKNSTPEQDDILQRTLEHQKTHSA